MRPLLHLALVAALLAPSVALAKKDHKKDRDREAPQLVGDKAPPAAPDTSQPTVQVRCSPPGAEVFIDGKLVGKAPIDKPMPVSLGEHTIKVVKLGHAPYIDVFSTKKQRQAKLEVELIPISGVLHVTANVAEARVLVDGKFVGVAPIDVEMEVGARAVQVEKGCYKEHFQNVLAVAGKDEAVEIKLEELPQNETNPCFVKPLPPPKWYQKKWVWGVIAGAAVVAAGAAVGGAVAATAQKDFCSTVDACPTVMPAPMMGLTFGF